MKTKLKEREVPKIYFKILEIFILKTLFNTGEYVITNKNFNPIKVFTILLLVGNVFFTIYLIKKINTIYERINRECPSVLNENKLFTFNTNEKSIKINNNNKPHIDIDDLLIYLNDKNRKGHIVIEDLMKYIHKEEVIIHSCEKKKEIDSKILKIK